MIERLVSVIVPAYEAEPFIDQALESALAQDYRPLEVIVVDDGSSDRTAEIASRYDVRLLRQPNRGPAAARNAGLAAARGEYVAILDADDLWPVDRVSLLVGGLEDPSGAGIAIGLTEIFMTPGELVPAHFPHQLENPVAGHMVALLARRSVFEEIGGYDEDLRLAEDIDWLMRAKDAGVGVLAVDQVVTRYRIHALNTSRDKAANQAAMLRVMRASLARRRGDSSARPRAVGS